MHLIVKLLVIYWTSCADLANGVEVTYEELQELNATCYPSDTCKEPRTDDSPGISWGNSCSCNRYCSYFNTCCVNSRHANVKPPTHRPSCRTVQMPFADTSYFMIDSCSNGGNSFSAWDTLCNEEWGGESDVMKLVPVTSMFTSITYKNYFCFRCYEKTNDFLYWNILLKGDSRSNETREMDDVMLSYSIHNETWVLTLEDGEDPIAVKLKFEVPTEVSSLPIECDPDVISKCHDNWTDDSTGDKCHGYTAVIYIRTNSSVLAYRNPHCALCNFESLDDMFCKTRSGTWAGGGGGYGHGAGGAGYAHKVRFSFTHLLDINRGDGEKVGKVKVCDDNLLWDPFAKKCRNRTCAIPGYVVKEGKCVPP